MYVMSTYSWSYKMPLSRVCQLISGRHCWTPFSSAPPSLSPFSSALALLFVLAVHFHHSVSLSRSQLVLVCSVSKPTHLLSPSLPPPPSLPLPPFLSLPPFPSLPPYLSLSAVSIAVIQSTTSFWSHRELCQRSSRLLPRKILQSRNKCFSS